MRIIGGNYRGKKLKALEGEDVRPTLDKVRQAIFNIIQFEIAGAKVLDVFAGSGAMGIEALSRGAEDVLFNDISKQSLEVVRQNCALIKHNPVTYNLSYPEFYRELSRKGKKFDIIFIDPPYKLGIGENAVELIFEYKLLNDNGYVIYEHLAENTFKNEQNLNVLKSKKYGTVAVEVIANYNQ